MKLQNLLFLALKFFMEFTNNSLKQFISNQKMHFNVIDVL